MMLRDLKRWTLPLFLLVCSASAFAQQPAPEKLDQLRTLSRDELDVIKVVTQEERAWNRGDLEGFASAFMNSPDILLVGDRIHKGFDDIVNDYRKSYPTRETMGTLDYSEIEPRILDERHAVVVGKYHLERSKKAGGSGDGLFSMVMEKTDKGWKIIVAHTS